jgi:hypothetical protein
MNNATTQVNPVLLARRMQAEMNRLGISEARLRRRAWAWRIPRRKVETVLAGRATHLNHVHEWEWMEMVKTAWNF